MKLFGKIAFVFFIGLFILDCYVELVYQPKQDAQNATTTGISFPGITTGFNKISNNLEIYLKSYPNQSDKYNANKKYAVYFTGLNCPYAQSFISSLNTVVDNPYY